MNVRDSQAYSIRSGPNRAEGRKLISRIELANILLFVVLAAPVLYAQSDKQGGNANRQATVQVDGRMERRDERMATKGDYAAGRATDDNGVDADADMQEQAEEKQK